MLGERCTEVDDEGQTAEFEKPCKEFVFVLRASGNECGVARGWLAECRVPSES